MYDTLTITKTLTADDPLTFVWYFSVRAEFEEALQALRAFETADDVNITKGKAAALPGGAYAVSASEFESWLRSKSWLREQLGLTAPAVTATDNHLDLLRDAIRTQQLAWDAAALLEHTITGDGYTPHQASAASEFLDELADLHDDPNEIGAEDLDRFMKHVATATAQEHAVVSFAKEMGRMERTSGLPAAIAVPYGQRPAVTLSYEQFVMAYEDHLRQGGTSVDARHVDASWQAYQHDPAGHFITQQKPAPKFTIGQMVYASVPAPQGYGVNGRWDWTGKVERITSTMVTGASEYEYLVSDAPINGTGEHQLLAWESELKPMFAPDGTMLDRNGNRSIFDDVDK